MYNELSNEGSEQASRDATTLDAVHSGDTVVYRNKRNREYRFEVADVDEEWVTFQTGQMVHINRFRREDFEVVRSGVDPAEDEGDIAETPEESRNQAPVQR